MKQYLMSVYHHLIPRYSGTKPVFSIEELRGFLNSLPSH